MYKKLAITLLLVVSILTGSAFNFHLPKAAVPEPSTVYDINGEVVQGLAEQNQVNVDIGEISPYFLNGIIAIEDKSFYQHHGIDISGIIRAAWINIKAREIVAGGSTITQQTAKTLFLSNDRTWTRKLKELYYTLLMENKYSKDEILTMYCNSIYFGQGAYGVELAARIYFAKSAQDLSLAQAALLAGLPQGPSYYDPYERPDAAKKRQEQVLQRMLDEGMISAGEKEGAWQEPLEYKRDKFADTEAPYFVAMVHEYLRDKYGDSLVYRGGLKVYTTLDLDMQAAANKAYLEGMKNKDASLQVALVALDVNTGQIRALVGGRDFSTSGYNRALAYRQPGSTFKPFVYSLALESDYNPASMVRCEEKEYQLPNGDTYKPTDYGTEPYHNREFTLKEALMISDNTIAVAVNNQLGPIQTASYAQQFGFRNIKPILSLPLGSNEVTPLDLAAGYCVFANQGIYHQPIYLLKVIDNNGIVLEENSSPEQRIISAENAYLITDMLTGVMESGGTGSALAAPAGRKTAGKTGTTEQKNDAWFVGYTPQLCCAVWVGYDQGKAANLLGGSAAGPIWASFIRDASLRLPEIDFPQPSRVDLKSICLDTGLVATETCPRQKQMAFMKSNQPHEICSLHSPVMNWITDLLPEDKEDTLQEWWKFWNMR